MRFKRKGIYVYLQLIHIVVQQKLAKHCKAIILQLKKQKKKRLCASTSGARVQSLVGELRSHIPHGKAKKEKIK